ncbi:MAG: hypothetical protein ACRD1C_09740 [Terriglobales bacterium]
MSFSLAVWLLGALAELVALAATFRRGLNRGLLWLRWYFALVLCGNLFAQVLLFRFGFSSLQYAYAYFLCDLTGSLFGFIVLARLVELAFERTAMKLPRLRLTAILLFTGVSVGSAAVVYLARGGFFHVVMELEQNFALLGMLLAVVLFAGMNLMRAPGLRFRRIVLSFSVMYSSNAIAYSLAAIFPGIFHALSLYVLPLIAPAFVALIAYSLWVPEPERTEWKAVAPLTEGLREVASW